MSGTTNQRPGLPLAGQPPQLGLLADVQPAATIARLGSIPHGDSLLAQGGAFAVPSGPVFATLSSLPTDSATGAVKGSPYTDPYTNPDALPPNFKPSILLNPNLALAEDIVGQTIIHTVVLIVSTNAVNLTTPTAGDPNDPNPGGTLISIPPPTGAIANIPFVTANANATKLDATFWIETVQQADGSTFQQLQYTQTVMLSFLGIDWPHIAVATLVKQ